MELVERTDPRYNHLPLYRHACTWRLYFDRIKARALDSECLVFPDENGYSGTVLAYEESELTTFVEKKEFGRFKVSPVQREDRSYVAHVEPRVLSWQPVTERIYFE
jgi:hypothetical protein